LVLINVVLSPVNPGLISNKQVVYLSVRVSFVLKIADNKKCVFNIYYFNFAVRIIFFNLFFSGPYGELSCCFILKLAPTIAERRDKYPGHIF